MRRAKKLLRERRAHRLCGEEVLVTIAASEHFYRRPSGQWFQKHGVSRVTRKKNSSTHVAPPLPLVASHAPHTSLHPSRSLHSHSFDSVELDGGRGVHGTWRASSFTSTPWLWRMMTKEKNHPTWRLSGRRQERRTSRQKVHKP